MLRKPQLSCHEAEANDWTGLIGFLNMFQGLETMVKPSGRVSFWRKFMRTFFLLIYSTYITEQVMRGRCSSLTECRLTGC